MIDMAIIQSLEMKCIMPPSRTCRIALRQNAVHRRCFAPW